MMTQAQPGSAGSNGKGQAFFERADEVAETGNWDYAIDLYLEGIKREPANVARGHQKLREVSLKRKFKGGKPVGMMEQFKRRGGKGVEALANAEYLLGKDPGNASLMEQVLSAARAMDLRGVAGWICNIMLDSQRQSAKPQRRILLLLVDAYSYVEDFALALAACQMAMQLSPGDSQLADLYSNLSAKHTIKAGKYDQEEGDFTKSVKDMAKQQELIQKDSMVQADSYLQQQIRRARQEYQASPNEAGKVNAFVDALLKIEDAPHEDEAIGVLQRAHQSSGAYQFKMRVGDIRIRQEDRRQRRLVEAGKPDEAAAHAKQKLAFEIEEFTERVANYPTDLGIRYELGVRQFRAGNYDEAIGTFQQARRDPRRSLQASNYLGLSFAHKGWLPEAAQTFEQALTGELTEDQTTLIRYNLGDAYEQMGQLEQANEQFSKVAQLDFNFKDVRSRVDQVRKKLRDKPPAAGGPELGLSGPPGGV
jgi:tetratricopeptide (TPR) repeat protein